MPAYLNLERHLAWMRLCNFRPATITGRRLLLLRLARWLCAPPSLATSAELGDFQQTWTVGPDTRANYVSHLRAFYGWLVAEGIRPDNPATRLAVPRLGRRLPRPIATEDLYRAVIGAPERIRPWLICAAWGGLRCVEIALLRRENVLEQLAEPVVIIAANATKGHNERAVPMPRDGTLFAELVPILPRRGWVFPRYDGQAGPNKANRVSAEGCEYLRSLGLADTMHSLRHWFGTRAYDASLDLRAVQELLGHRSLRSTELYTKVSDAARIRAVSALPRLPSAL